MNQRHQEKPKGMNRMYIINIQNEKLGTMSSEDLVNAKQFVK